MRGKGAMRFLNFLLTSVILAFAVSAGAADMDGFRDIPWGSDVKEIRKTDPRLVEGNRGGMAGVEAYLRTDEDLSFGGIKSEGIAYNFYNVVFTSVSIEFRGFDNFEKLLAYCKKQFGPPTASAVLRLEQYAAFDAPKTGAMLLYQLSQQTSNYGRLYLYSKKYLK